MNTNIDSCDISKNIIISKRTILKFINIIAYLLIYTINYKKINAYFNKKVEEKKEENVDEDMEEDLRLIRPVDDEEETLEINDFEGTGEQLRRLRANNPKNDDETEEDYESRIWSMAYKEDEEEEEEKNRERKVQEDKEEEKDVNTWYTIKNGESQYKGEWKNGVPHGKGIEEAFEGRYKDANGKPCDSKGESQCWSIIECNFVDGYAEGYGKQTYKQEKLDEEKEPYYEGEFHKGLHHGQGKYDYGNGTYYKGNFKESMFHGVGYHYYVVNKKTWIGEFDNDERTKGIWIDGELE